MASKAIFHFQISENQIWRDQSSDLEGAMKWIWLLGIAGYCATATAAAQSTDASRPDARDFDTPIAWFDAVDTASTSQGMKSLGTAFRGANVLLTFGLQSAAVRSLPPRFSSIPREEIGFKVYVSPNWDVPPYGQSKGRDSARIPRVDLALSDWCEAHGGQAYEPEMGTWTCERNAQFMAIADWSRRKAIAAPFFTVMQPLDTSAANALRFSDLVRSAGFTPKSELDARMASQRSEREQQRRAWTVRQEAEAPLRRKIGSKLCQDDLRYGTRYIGFVEGKSPDLDKVQIRIITRIFQGPAQSVVGGFQEQVVWSDPDAWYICD